MTLQVQFLTNLLRKNKDSVIIGSLGTISYDLRSILEAKPYAGKVHMIAGAMGCVMGTGLGYALASKKKVIVVIGDGAFLMKMGSIATILKYKPKNLKVYILNNRRHASCGNQATNFKYIKKILPKQFQVIDL